MLPWLVMKYIFMSRRPNLVTAFHTFRSVQFLSQLDPSGNLILSSIVKFVEMIIFTCLELKPHFDRLLHSFR